MNRLTKDFFLAILTALLFSAFIYLEHIGITNKLLNTLFGLGAIALLLYIPKRALLITGFFIGILWFYWIGYSFEYQGVGYMQPIVTFGFGILYLIFFAPLAFSNNALVRAALLFGLSFIEPLGWNWMKIELPFINSYFGVYKYQFAIILLALSLPYLIKEKKYRFLPLLLLIFALNYGYPKQSQAPLKIKLVETQIPQEVKWRRSSIYPTVAMIFDEIAKAKQEGYDIIVFPESVFPLFLNKFPKLLQELSRASQGIAIIAGALMHENDHNYNVTYIFNDGEYSVAKKMILVPFGEYIPLPKFAQKFINDTFFQGGSDFVTAKEPTDFTIKGVKFRNAICYEATCQELYEGDVKYMIASSNNGWFVPSIEPTLQKLLLEYYGRKNGVTIYHAANMSATAVIK
ncbi:MAG TPA: apolipoprotein N-acyltransferase [Sulfurimonas autotrophica]|nr:apolipoprotein N-acyltransferase [Sulfurimonas autotrophica]